VTYYPVHYAAERPARYTRLQLLIRLAASIALGILGLSLGLVFMVAYVALPAFAATRLSQRDGQAFLGQDGPKLVRALRWLAAVYAWFAFVTDALPERDPEEHVKVAVETMGQPSASAALWRLVVGLPSAFVLAILGCIGGLVWLWAALSVLCFERVGETAHAYLAGVQRWAIRLLAYQASLVDVYPPFSFDDAATTLPQATLR
jgi:Domain of unknown function (DUF4389)